MPSQFYSGDSFAIKIEAINWIRNNEFGFTYNRNYVISDFLSVKNHAFRENSTDQVHHNRWGLFNLVIFSIPELLLKNKDIIYSSDNLIRVGSESILMHNYFNIIITIFIVLFTYKIALLYTKHTIPAVVFVISVLYASFVWNYLRAQSYEIIHLLFFTVFYYYFILYLRRLINEKLILNSEYYIFNLLLLFLCLSKSFYFILFPISYFIILFKIYGYTNNSYKLICSKFNLIVCTLPGLVTFFLFLYMSYYFYGNLFLGYLHHNPGLNAVSYSFSFIPARLYDYFLSNNRSLFIHMPALIIAFFCIYDFYKKYRYEALFLILLFCILTAFFICLYSVGEWCYGPRYYLFSLSILSIPALIFINRFYENLDKTPYLFTAMIYMIFCAYFINLQTELNHRPFFAAYYIKRVFKDAGIPVSPELKEYLNKRNMALINRDIDNFIDTGKETYFSLQIYKNLPDEYRRKVKYHHREILDLVLPVNKYPR